MIAPDFDAFEHNPDPPGTFLGHRIVCPHALAAVVADYRERGHLPHLTDVHGDEPQRQKGRAAHGKDRNRKPTDEHRSLLDGGETDPAHA